MTKTVTTSAMEAVINGLFDADTTYGKFNDYPPNMEQISEGEFWHRFLSYSPSSVQYRQMIRPEAKHKWMYKDILEKYSGKPYPNDNGPFTEAKLFIYDQHLGLMVTDNHEVNDGKEVKVRYWKFFDHEAQWEGMPKESYMHYTVSRCKVCGMKQGIDSSG